MFRNAENSLYLEVYPRESNGMPVFVGKVVWDVVVEVIRAGKTMKLHIVLKTSLNKDPAERTTGPQRSF